MPIHKWRKRLSKHFGEVWAPFAQVEIQCLDGSFQPLVLQLDSGAVVSLLRRSMGDLLGVDFEAGRKIEVTSVGGGQTIAYAHKLETRFGDGIAYPVPFAIATSESVPNLLGRFKVFDWLQMHFDGTLEETRVAAPWLDKSDRKIWEFLIATEGHILQRWQKLEITQPARDVAVHFVNRAGQVLASAVALLKCDNTYAGPLLVRTMFELALQYEYLMDDPEPRAQQYLDFQHITKHKQSTAVANNPSGPLSRFLASSPDRPEGEKRNKAEYDRVRPKFVRPRKRGREHLWANWYCMTVRDLAEEVGYLGEYRLAYSQCSAWAHGDPSATVGVAGALSPWGMGKNLFVLCVGYHARILLKIADVGKILLTSEQHGFLRKIDPDWAS